MHGEGRDARLLRACRTLAAVATARTNAASEVDLLTVVCRIAVEDAGYRLAWAGYVDRSAPHAVRPVAHAGCDEGYLATLRVTGEEGAHGRGPTGVAVRTGRAAVAQNIHSDPAFAPWRAEAEKRGYASSVSLPLRDDERVFGALNLYAPEPHAFDADELAFLERLTAVVTHDILCARGRLRLGHMERELQRLDRLETAGRVAATIAHDVNNCLAVILPCLDDVRSDALRAEARRAIDRAVALNRELLRLARRPDERAEPLAIDAEIARLVPSLRLVAAPTTVTFEPAAGDVAVRLDRDRLNQALANLVVNARDAMDGSGEVRLQTALLALCHPLPAPYIGVGEGSYVAIRVTDSGAGMTQEVRDRLFEPFFTTKGEKGSGLGLASVHAIVRDAHGNVFVDSVPGKTTFELLIPAE